MNIRAAVKISAAGTDSAPAVRVTIIAYNGAPMNVEGLRKPLLVDLAGVVFRSPQTPLCVDHDVSVAGLLGTVEPQVDARAIVVSGVISSASEPGRKIIEMHRDGVAFQASIGAELLARSDIAPGIAVKVNGRTFAQHDGLILSTQTQINEISIVALGADGNTSVRIAAGLKLGDTQMDNVINDIEVPADSIAASRVAAAADTRRIAAVRKACKGRFPDIEAKAIEEGWSADQASLAIYKAETPRTPALRTWSGARGATDAAQIRAAMLVRCGFEAVAVKDYGEQAVESSKPLHRAHALDLCRAALQIDGVPAPDGKAELVRAALSNHTLTDTLANTANRVLLEGYRETPATWRSFSAIRSTDDFKDNTGVRPTLRGNLEPVAKGGEIKHATMSESKYSWSVDTFAKMLSLDRKDVINDNLNAFADAARAMGRMAQRSLNDHVYRVLMTSAGYFTVGNGNLIEDAGPLSIFSFSDAFRKMMSQRDEDGNDLDLRPAVLVVPPALADVAKQILTSESVVYLVNDAGAPTSLESRGTANPNRNAVKLEIEPRLANTVKYPANASDEDWYLFGSPADAPVTVGFLNGVEEPTVEYFGFDSEPSRLAATWRVYMDYGAAMSDFRAALKADAVTA